jgi:uncharacterized protein (DUF4415 family)
MTKQSSRPFRTKQKESAGPVRTTEKRATAARPLKKQLTLRLDTDVVAWFKDHAPKGGGYQTEINRALREHVRRRIRAAS